MNKVANPSIPLFMRAIARPAGAVMESMLPSGGNLLNTGAAVGQVGLRGAAALGRGGLNMARRAPGATLMAGVLAPTVGPEAIRSAMEPIRGGAATADQIAGGFMNKISSAPFSPEALDRAFAFRTELAKTAAAAPAAPPPTFGQALGAAGRAMGVGGLMTLGGVGVLAGLAGLSRGVNVVRRNKQYERMLEADKELQHYAKRNPQAVRAAFNMVQRASPYVASEPLVAATVVRQISADYAGQADEQKLNNLLRVEKDYQDTRVPYAGAVTKLLPSTSTQVR